MTKYIDRYYLNGEMYGIKFYEAPDFTGREGLDQTYGLTDRGDGLGPTTEMTDAPAYIMKPIGPLTGNILSIETEWYVSDPGMRGGLTIMLMSMTSFDDTTQALTRNRMDVAGIPLYQGNPYDGVGGQFYDAINDLGIQGDEIPYLSDQVQGQITGKVKLSAIWDPTTYHLTIKINNYQWTVSFYSSDTTFIDNLMAEQDLAIILNCGRGYGNQSMYNRLYSVNYEITPVN